MFSFPRTKMIISRQQMLLFIVNLSVWESSLLLQTSNEYLASAYFPLVSL